MFQGSRATLRGTYLSHLWRYFFLTNRPTIRRFRVGLAYSRFRLECPAGDRAFFPG